MVADLETTGLNSRADEILEFAAIRVNAEGVIQEEFSTVVNIGKRVPVRISELTGITDADVTLVHQHASLET